MPTPDVMQAEAETLADSISDEVIASALASSAAYAAAQNQTVANIRSRAATVLSSAAVVVTFTTAIGLIANDPSHGGVRLHPVVGGILCVVLLAIGVLTLYPQWPYNWTFTSGTDVWGGHGSLAAAQRAAFVRLEVGVRQNRDRIAKLLTALQLSVALLGVEALVVVLGILLS